MASVETHWFTKGGKNLIEAEVGWVSSAIAVALMAAGYAFDQDVPEVYADVSASEAAGAGYVAGGTPLPTRSVTIDPVTNETRLLGGAVQWPGSTILASGAVIYANVAAKPLLGYVNFGTDRRSNGGVFRIEWPDPWVLRTRAL
jgi:hypothetical protein